MHSILSIIIPTYESLDELKSWEFRNKPNYFKNIDLYCVDNFWGNYLKDKEDEVKMINDWGVNFIYADQGNFCDWNELKQECPKDFDFIVDANENLIVTNPPQQILFKEEE
jgi:hypothetical protein